VIVAAILERCRHGRAHRLAILRVQPSCKAREVQRLRLRKAKQLAPLVRGPNFIARDVPHPEPKVGRACRQIHAPLTLAQLF
jgi:hypothetical protein